MVDFCVAEAVIIKVNTREKKMAEQNTKDEIMARWKSGEMTSEQAQTALRQLKGAPAEADL